MTPMRRDGRTAAHVMVLTIAGILATIACAAPAAVPAAPTSPAAARLSPTTGPHLPEDGSGPQAAAGGDPDVPVEGAGGNGPEASAEPRPSAPVASDDPSPDDQPEDRDETSAGPDTSTTRTIVIAGDIAGCDYRSDSATAQLVEQIPGVVMTAGDNAYPAGSYEQFQRCYAPTWGRFRYRTRPTPGNHDWATPKAAGYFRYFGRRAGPPGRGYYAFDVGVWRVYALAGDCGQVEGCRASSPQFRWLAADLAARPRRCVLAVWHQPRFSSGPHGTRKPTKPLFRLLYESGAEVIINGHDHGYERFGPATDEGEADASHGIRQIVVGTGGAPLYGHHQPFAPNSQVRNGSTHGVLKLRLAENGYAWRFIPVAGGSFTDSGSGTCHGRPPA